MSTAVGVSAATCASGVRIKRCRRTAGAAALTSSGVTNSRPSIAAIGLADQEQVYGGPRAGPHLDLRRRPRRPHQLAQIAQDLREWFEFRSSVRRVASTSSGLVTGVSSVWAARCRSCPWSYASRMAISSSLLG